VAFSWKKDGGGREGNAASSSVENTDYGLDEKIIAVKFPAEEEIIS